MKKGNTTWGEWLSTNCVRFSSFTNKHPIWWEIFRFGSIALPLGVLALLSYPFESTTQPGWHKTIKSWVDLHWIFLLLIVFIPAAIQVVLDLILKQAVSFNQQLDIGSKNVTAVLTAINSFVGQKLHRFGMCAQKIETNAAAAITKKEVFEEITQPDTQIGQIVTQIYLVTRALTNDESLKVVLVEISPSQAGTQNVHYACYLPSDNHPSLEIINKHWNESFFGAVSNGDSPKIIADIGKHLRSKAVKNKLFFPATRDVDDEGSIIGFPLYNTFLQRVTHVLTIRSDVRGRLSQSFRKSFHKYLEFFFTRIHLEYNLKIIKHAAT